MSGAGLAAAVASATARRQPNFIRRAHLARDDWAHDPLARPMRTGVASFEIGVWLDRTGRVQVGARKWDRDPGNAIGPRVLDRLAERAADHGGRMFPRQRGSITLMLEIVETDVSNQMLAYEALDAVLARYGHILARFDHGSVVPGPVTVLLTGENTPRQFLAAQPKRFAFADGTFADIGAWGAPANLVPMVSEDWAWRFGWDGRGAMPAAERLALRDLVEYAHADGRRVRFFGLPQRSGHARTAFWHELISAGVDLLTVTRDVRALARHLRRHGSVRHTVAIAPRVRSKPASAVGAPR